MTSEQEKAIKRLEKRIKDNEDYKTTQVWLTDDVSAVYTVLNMLKENSEEIKNYKKKNTELSNQMLMLYKKQDNNAARIDKKNAEIEKYKYLYQKALDNTIEADRENIQLKKQIDLMAERLRFDEELKFEVCKDCEPLKEELCGEPTKTQYQPTELKCVKQYFERKASE